MRSEFSHWIAQFGKRESRLVFLTADLGYGALENVQAVLGARFVNMGVCEQNMISVAAGLAQQGLLPLCYSIAPFAVFRPYEQIRVDVALHGFPVKIVGNGGGYGYGIMGATHHALEDLAVMSCLPNFACMVPLCNSDVAAACEALFQHQGPAYLRLGLGVWPIGAEVLPDFQPVRCIVSTGSAPPKLTVAGIGPVLLNILPCLGETRSVDVFAISQLPLASLGSALRESVTTSRNLLVLEEHCQRGGLGEHLAATLASEGVAFRLHHRHAAGYPERRYGSQGYHQRQSGLDTKSLQATLAGLLS
jgi:transketolase